MHHEVDIQFMLVNVRYRNTGKRAHVVNKGDMSRAGRQENKQINCHLISLSVVKI